MRSEKRNSQEGHKKYMKKTDTERSHHFNGCNIVRYFNISFSNLVLYLLSSLFQLETLRVFMTFLN